MSDYIFYDTDIENFIQRGEENEVELLIKKEVEAVVITKDDVIALAKMVNLIVYEIDSAL